MDKRLLLLINSYLVVVMLAQQRMQRHGINIPLTKAAWQSTKIPEYKMLGDGISFDKHDFGCTVTFPAGPVTMEFEEDGKMFGLLIKNLEAFAGDDLEGYGFKSAADLADAFELAYKSGVLEMPSGQLAYLKSGYSYI